MKPYDTEVSEFDKDFTSIKNKINLSGVEQQEILFQINTKLNKKKNWKRILISWKPLMALAAALFVITVLSFPSIQERTGISLFNKPMTAEEVVEAYYQAYNNKDYETYHSFGSNRVEKEFEEIKMKQELSDEDLHRSWLKSWVPAEVIQIKDHGGTSKKTTVVAIIHYPSTLLSPEATKIVTYELIKEDREWKIDKVINNKGI
jgi:hypothetical protein